LLYSFGIPVIRFQYSWTDTVMLIYFLIYNASPSLVLLGFWKFSPIMSLYTNILLQDLCLPGILNFYLFPSFFLCEDFFHVRGFLRMPGDSCLPVCM
jgi:hypothetical protein